MQSVRNRIDKELAYEHQQAWIEGLLMDDIEQTEQDAEWAQYLYDEAQQRVVDAMEGIRELEYDQDLIEFDREREDYELICRLRELADEMEKRYLS